MERLVLIASLLALMKDNVNCIVPGLRRTTIASRSGSRFLLNCSATFVAIAVSAAVANSESATGSKQSSSNPTGSSAGESPATSVSVLNPATNGEKSGKVDPQNLVGHASPEVESALGKPTGKLQTVQGALWL